MSLATWWYEEGVIYHAGGCNHWCSVGGGSGVGHTECATKHGVGVYPLNVAKVSGSEGSLPVRWGKAGIPVPSDDQRIKWVAVRDYSVEVGVYGGPVNLICVVIWCVYP